jgi:hypothetical protein
MADNPCYRLVPDNAVTEACGWTDDTQPDGPFQGDSSYTWSIHFPAGSDKSCVTYWFEDPDGSARPADFSLAAVKALDSSGDEDDLALLGGTTLLGGTSPRGSSGATQMLPLDVPLDRPTTLTVLGTGLADVTGLTLEGVDGSVRATDLHAYDDYTLTADVVVPPELEGAMSVVLDRRGAGATSVGTVDATGTYAVLTVNASDTGAEDAMRAEYATATACGPTYYSPPPDANPNCQRMMCMLALCPSLFPIWGGRGCSTSETYYSYSCYFNVYIDGAPAVGLPMRLDYSPQPYTGGHGHHDDARPAAHTIEAHEPRDIVRELRNTVNTTDALGRFPFYFVTPEVAGGLVLTLYSTDPARPFNPLQEPSAYFCVREPDLVAMPDTVAGAVADSGGTDNRVRHTSFHWGRADVLEALYKVAANYSLAFPTALPLRVNDISLQFGGRLDFASATNWEPPHCGHRRGTSVDVKFVPGIKSGVLLEWFNGGKTKTRQRSSQEGLRRRFRVAIHSSNHYHCDF